MAIADNKVKGVRAAVCHDIYSNVRSLKISKMGKSKVWVLGSSNIDYTYNVERLPLKGQTIAANDYKIGTGGKGANQAIAASHFGSNVFFIGAVGNDSEGKALLNALKKWNINTDNVKVLQGLSSGNAVIYVDKNGDNCITVFPGANQKVPHELINSISFKQGDHLIAQLEVNIDVIEKSFISARKNKTTTVLNPSPFQAISDTLIKNTDIIILNETEASEMTGISVTDEKEAKESAKILQKSGIGTIIITLGGKGVVFSDSSKSIYFPGHKVKVVDTQGAGDAFIGTFISNLTKGATIEESVSLANYVASISVTRKGSTQICLPDPNKIDLNFEDQQR